jgi:trk system potassium uptake protein TrkA
MRESGRRNGDDVHVVVVGCGRVGSGVATSLSEQGHSVAVIDRQASAFRRLSADFAGRTVLGVGFDRERLKVAGIEEATALAAVTNGDNSNIVVARVAREAFGIERVVARIYDPRRAAIYERLGIPTVATVGWAIQRTLRRILPGTSGVEWTDPSAKVCIVERAVPDAWAGRALEDFERPGTARIAGLTRLGVGSIPGPTVVAQQGDVLWAAVAVDAVDDFDAFLAAGPGAGGH